VVIPQAPTSFGKPITTGRGSRLLFYAAMEAGCPGACDAHARAASASNP
jgi:hypothetical protein